MSRIVFVLLLLFCVSLTAHPPKTIELGYDEGKAALSVKVWHKVSDAEDHYIKRIVVFLGDNPIAEKTYKRQQSNEYQEEIFTFGEKPLQKGDAVRVQAFCNLSGKKTVDLEWAE